MTTNIQITARIHDSCPAGACLVVAVPPSPEDLFPGLFAEEVVVECAACRERAAQLLAAHEAERMAEAKASAWVNYELEQEFGATSSDVVMWP